MCVRCSTLSFLFFEFYKTEINKNRSGSYEAMPRAHHWQNYSKSSKQNTNNGHKLSNVGAASTSTLISTTTTTTTTTSSYHHQQHSDGSEMVQPLHRVSSPHPQQHTTATLTTTSGKRPTAATASATKAFAILKQNIHHQQMHHPQQPNSNVQSTHTGKQTSGGRGRGVLGIQQQQYGKQQLCMQ